jgi:phage gpG-like protein
VDGEKQFDRGFSRFTHHIEDLRYIWKDVQKDFYEIEQKQFQSQGAHSNTWQPLSKKYGEWKAKKHPGKQILELSGTLWKSLTSAGANGAVFISEPDSMAVGTSIKYAQYHQRGTRKMPKRKPIDLVEADKRQIGRTIHRRLVGVAREDGFQVQGGAI